MAEVRVIKTTEEINTVQTTENALFGMDVEQFLGATIISR